jgi:hypothetical protein
VRWHIAHDGLKHLAEFKLVPARDTLMSPRAPRSAFPRVRRHTWVTARVALWRLVLPFRGRRVIICGDTSSPNAGAIRGLEAQEQELLLVFAVPAEAERRGTHGCMNDMADGSDSAVANAGGLAATDVADLNALLGQISSVRGSRRPIYLAHRWAGIDPSNSGSDERVNKNKTSNVSDDEGGLRVLGLRLSIMLWIA